MDRRSGRVKRGSRIDFKSEKGYLLVSTLFFLVFSAIFAGSMIRISGIQILQYNQLTTAYEAKAALNMSETILLEHLESNETLNNGEISTSVGEIVITSAPQLEGTMYLLIFTNKRGLNFTKELWVPQEIVTEDDELEELEESEEVYQIENQEELELIDLNNQN